MAEPLTFSIPHSLGTDEAKMRVSGGIGQLESMIPGSQMTESEWEGDVLHFAITAFGQQVTTQLAFHDDRIDAELNLPPLLAGFAGKFRDKFRQLGQKLLR